MKIPARFLKIREEKGRPLLDYLDRDGNLRTIDILYHSDQPHVRHNIADLKKQVIALSVEQDEPRRKTIQAIIDFLILATHLPEIYAAYCDEAPIAPFFGNSPEASEKEEPTDSYAPNRKYQTTHFKEFTKLWQKERNQALAYDELTKRSPETFRPERLESFLIRYRKWRKESKVRL